MKSYLTLTNEERRAELEPLQAQYAKVRECGLKLDMSRGKPDPTQLNLSMDMLSQNPYDLIYSRKGTDVRNYGELAGVDEAKELFGAILGVPMQNVIMGGQSHLRFLCPVPGYDRHFRICEEFGVEMISIPMSPAGPDMELVRQYAESDPSVKGIWCVPKYSNPQGYTYSDETVRAFAALKPAADDFRIFWDNAYMVHGFREKDDELLNIFDACREFGSEDMVYEFMSTSKVTFSGAGVAVFAASEHNVKHLLRQMSVQTIGYDKINQLRHVRYLKSVEGVKAHMKKQADYLRPKFDFTLAALESGLRCFGIGDWTNPNGGYFISYDGLPGTAARCVQLCGDAGVKLTPAGAAFPYGIDPEDKNIRIAPTFLSFGDLNMSMEVFCLCQRIAALEALLAEKA